MAIILHTLNHTVRKKNKYWHDMAAKGTMFGDLTYRYPYALQYAGGPSQFYYSLLKF